MHDYRLLRLSLRLLLAMTEESPLRHCEIPQGIVAIYNFLSRY
ncbi:hypothetical protein [Helicobacter rodentium]|nr:hypothetical protein [Helicobacter rodentium]